jgi:hypothetical protein
MRKPVIAIFVSAGGVRRVWDFVQLRRPIGFKQNFWGNRSADSKSERA